MVQKIAIFLCDLTGNMAKPWVEAGYHVVLVDPQHPPGANTEGQWTRIGATIIDAMEHLGPIIRSGLVRFVAGFPPCTDVSLSGTRWWAKKRHADPYFQAKAAMVAEQCRMIGMACGCPWFFENPASAFSRMFGSPQHKFQPHWFTRLWPSDNYKKETWLWTGGGFVMPNMQKDESLGAPDDRIHKCPPGAERGNIRSATPMGFAIAVHRANDAGG